MQTKYVCFTINNYTEEESKRFDNEIEGVSYFVVGREIGESGTPHLQGYAEFTKRHRLSKIKSVLGQRAHIEARRGTALEASQYCKKSDNDFREMGSISGSQQGKRTDLENVQKMIRDGRSILEVAEEEFGSFVRYEKSIRNYKAMRESKRNWQPDVYVLWGKTGTGKTRKVFEENEGCDIYMHPGSSWFDGYYGQSVVLFDDFTGSEFKLGYLLKLLDRYPFSVPIKGSYVNFVPKKIYITSNIDPRSWYSGCSEEHKAALFRRFTTVTHYDSL